MSVKIGSRDGGQFDCYLALPESRDRAPSLVLASAIHGVDADLRSLADEFASYGFIAAAPDLFWRSVPGPLSHGDPRAAQRARPRPEKIAAGETDLEDTLTFLRSLPNFGGRAAVMGLCYGGPYALIGPKRLGYSAGISCHGTNMLDYIGEADGLARPVSLLWGDQDEQAPPAVLKAYAELKRATSSISMRVFAGVRHGYMMRGNPSAFDLAARDASVATARAVLDKLSNEPS
jgi:carboxymethylenebutenolidase